MNNFREQNPSKREIDKVVSKYQNHKSDLKIDFNNRCGYCDDHATWRSSFYEIDHFVPKQYLSGKEITDYGNLVYSCRYCNNSKRAKWPTGDKNNPNDGKAGFEKPWTSDYSNIFRRDDKGRIVSDSDLGNWMIKNLNLGLKRHSIIWQLDKLKSVVEQIKTHYESKESIDPKIEFLLEYIKLNEMLRDNI
ncbi:HNH endonuclease signature motif containing protein [Labilibaculum sp. K2S]|uniref:HNH endonuclease n=1 Tax=Labilibaculum sp. K2S TaxID=3056386 RepID=UPI0025A49111|nr:HNH endonuclease signature motif containing protein [Labilibaculum sp. K2S]MDM8159064.1 HNH endonuclease signature motif containing protein [Labilibaculum sp. K2S]